MNEQVGSFWEKTPTISLFVLIGLLLLSSSMFLIVFCSDDPQWIYPRLGLEAKRGGKYEALKFLGIGMGGLLIAIQALMSYKRAKALEDTVKNAEQGQRQERLKNAIEHLGHASDSVRLGGAYELFHLAEETKEWRQTILDILCAHIRRTTGEKEYQDKYPSNPSEEIQSLLTLLFLQERKVFAGLDTNLDGSWLNGSNLSQARLEKASLVGAQLHGASLINAQLHGAHLIETRLCGANLWNAQLHETRLWSTDLRGVNGFPGYVNDSFEVVINRRIGWESDLGTVIFAGGLTPEDIASIGTGLFDEDAKSLREKLKAHIKEAESHELPDNSGPFGPMSDPSIGAYTKEEADQWIAEYKTVVSRGEA